MGKQAKMSMNGMGVIPCWGNGPCVDLTNTNKRAKNVLALGTGEFGHVLKTAAAAKLRANEEAETVNAYMVERHPETLARHCILLATALDLSIGLRERTELFL